MDNSPIIKKIKETGKRLFFFDYDGTLMPFTKIPSLATPDAEIIQILLSLSADKKNTIVIISGRNIEMLDKWLGNMDLIIVAEHGAIIKYPGGAWKTLVEANDEWKKNIFPLLELFTKRCAGSFVEEKDIRWPGITGMWKSNWGFPNQEYF